MTWKAWPINANTGAPAYDALAFRQLEAVWNTPHPSGASRPLGAYSGRTPNSWLVTLSALVINIAPGAGVLDVETTATNGAYRVASDATDSTLSVTAQGGTARIDGVYIQLDDTDIDGSTFRKALPVYVAGTPGSGTPPTGGSIPARSLRIATIAVPATGGGSPAVTVEPLYTVALGGTLPVANSAAYPASPYPGQKVYDIALGYELFWNSSAWRPTSSPADSTWVNVVGGVGYQNSWATYLIAPQYRLIGNRVSIRGSVQSGTAGASAFTLPSAYRPTQAMEWGCVNSGGTTNNTTHVSVLANGVVQPASNTFGVYLDAISFYID